MERVLDLRHGHRDHTRKKRKKSDFPLTFPMDEATNLFSGLEGNDKAKSEADDVGEYDGYPQRLITTPSSVRPSQVLDWPVLEGIARECCTRRSRNERKTEGYSLISASREHQCDLELSTALADSLHRTRTWMRSRIQETSIRSKKILIL